MPTFNSGRTIVPVIDAMILALQNFTWKLTVVDGGSADNTLQLIRDRVGRLTILRENMGNQGLAVDLGILNLEGDYVLFLDSDVVVPVDFFTKLLKHFDTPDIVAAEAGLTNMGEEYQAAGIVEATSASRACLIAKRSALSGVDTRLKVAEDVNLTQQLLQRGKILRDNTLVCKHIRRFKVLPDMKRAARYWYYQGLNYYLLLGSTYKDTLRKVAVRSILFMVPSRKNLGYKICERLGFLIGLVRWRWSK